MAEDKTTYKNWALVFNIPNEYEKSPLEYKQAINECICKYGTYYLILHDKDIYSKEDYEQDHNHIEGQPKRPHIHVVLSLDNKTTKSKLLEEISSDLNVDKKVISLDNARSIKYCIQYLIHLNHPKKHQYDYKAIVSNDVNINLYFLTDNEITKSIMSSNTALDLIKSVGVENARKYLPLFKEVKKSSEENSQQIMSELHQINGDLRKIIDLAVSELAEYRKSDKTTEYDRLYRLVKKS